MEKLDQEWVKLIFEAKELGLSIKDIEEFFLNQSTHTKELSLK